MDKLKRHKKILLTVAVLSAVIGAISVIGIIFFILRLWYVPMALCIAVTAHAFYGCPFYFIAYSNAGICERVIHSINDGEDSLEAIAKRADIKPEFAKTLIRKALSKGYIEDFEPVITE